MKNLLILILSIVFFNVYSQKIFSDKKLILQTEARGFQDIYMADDVNGDGYLDYFGNDEDGQELYFSANETFHKKLLNKWTYDLPITFTDINNDGLTDIMTDAQEYYMKINQDSFKLSSHNAGSYKDFFLAYKDINGDGYSDAISTISPAFGNASLIVYFNDGASSFRKVLLDDTEKDFGYTKVLDFNMDGKMDIATVINNYSGTSKVKVFINDGDETFTAQVYNFDFDVHDENMELADFDNDGDIDFVLNGSKFYLLENTGSGFEKKILENYLYFSFYLFYKSADIDYDGDLDIVCIANLDSKMQILYYVNNGEMDFSSPVRIGEVATFSSVFFQNPNYYENWFSLKDFDSDGDVDIILNAAVDKKLYWFDNLTITSENTSINTQPKNGYICEGKSIKFKVEASGTNNKFQWQKNNLDIENAIEETFTINPVSKEDEGDYRCIVTGALNSDTSDIATLTVFENIQIVSEPESVTAEYDKKAEFSVEVSGSIFSYRWYKGEYELYDNSRIQGSSSNQLIISNVTFDDIGEYHCEVSGQCNILNSTTVTLAVWSATRDLSDAGISISPNPAHDQINISTTGTEIEKLEIYNTTGQKVLTFVSGFNTLDISSLKAGMYYVKVVKDGEEAVGKLVVK